MYRLTGVVKQLLILNVITYVITLIVPELMYNTLALHYPMTAQAGFLPLQIVTHMFMHGSTMHIFFNMFSLFIFGPQLESLWGPKKFLFYYLFAGFGSFVLFSLWAYYPFIMDGSAIRPTVLLGASGAIMGILIAFALNFPNVELMLLFPPIPIKAKYLVMILIGVDLYFGFSNQNTGIAHFAHLGGALSGFLLILYWDRFGSKL